jgi:hypothetical protein
MVKTPASNPAITAARQSMTVRSVLFVLSMFDLVG